MGERIPLKKKSYDQTQNTKPGKFRCYFSNWETESQEKRMSKASELKDSEKIKVHWTAICFQQGSFSFNNGDILVPQFGFSLTPFTLLVTDLVQNLTEEVCIL